MKKLNLIAASAAMLVAGLANAGTLTAAVPGGTVFAAENFGGSSTAATNDAVWIVPGAVTYGVSNITAVNAGASVYFTVRLSNAQFNATPVAGDFTFAGGATGAGITVMGVSSDKSTVLVQATATGTNSVTLGLGAFSYAPATATGTSAEINHVTGLGTVGAQVTATIGMTTTAPSAYEATNAQSTVDLPLASTVVATSAAAVSGTVTALPTQTTKIDLTVSPAGSKFVNAVSTNGVALGGVTFTNVTGTQNQISGAADYTLDHGSTNADNTKITVTVTPGAGQSFPLTSVLSLNTATDCAAGTAVGTNTVTVTTSNATKAASLASTAHYVAATTVYVCMTAPGVDANSVQQTMSPLTVSLSGKVSPTVGSDLIAAATGTGFALAFNGSTITTNSYFPVAISQYGYSTYTRLVNAGAVTASVSASFVDGGTGAVGSSAVIAANLAPGAAVLLNNTTIEAALGTAPAISARPRLKITAPTDKLIVQSFVQSADGTFTEVSASQNNLGNGN